MIRINTIMEIITPIGIMITKWFTSTHMDLKRELSDWTGVKITVGLWITGIGSGIIVTAVITMTKATTTAMTHIIVISCGEFAIIKTANQLKFASTLGLCI
jgi:hypothetical protein